MSLLIRSSLTRVGVRNLQVRLHTHIITYNRLASSLAILEQKDGKLHIASLAAVTAGKKVGGTVTGLLAGKDIKSVAEEASKVDGLDKVLYIENDAYSKGLPENYAPMVLENIKSGGYTHVFAGHSAFGTNLMPRLAALLDVQQISDITEIKSEDSTSFDTFSLSI